ncbi:MAG: hypothetical protein LBO72_02985 [Helicobacteraceae bacterium]|nr:hypothetical protein [Helicobacteraceae bacterium]
MSYECVRSERIPVVCADILQRKFKFGKHFCLLDKRDDEIAGSIGNINAALFNLGAIGGAGACAFNGNK